MTAPEVNELVERWWPLACGIARKWGDRFPWLRDCFESAAVESLWKAAQKFGSDGNARFPGVVRKAVRWAILARLNQERRENPTAFAPRVYLTALDLVTDGAPEVGCRLEAADELAHVLARAELSDREHDAFTRHFADGTPLSAIAVEQNVSSVRIGQLVARCREKLRAAAEAKAVAVAS